MSFNNGSLYVPGDLKVDGTITSGGGGSGIGGSIAEFQIAVGTAAGEITGSNNFYWDESDPGLNELGIGGDNGFGHVVWDDDLVQLRVEGESSPLVLQGSGVAIGNASSGSYSSSGAIRLQKNFSVKSLNSAGDGDLPVLTMTADDTLSVGDPTLSGGAVVITNGASIEIAVGTADLFLDSSGAMEFAGGGQATFDGPVSANFMKLVPQADPPGSPAEGMIYADTDHHLYYYNGTTWKQLDN